MSASSPCKFREVPSHVIRTPFIFKKINNELKDHGITSTDETIRREVWKIARELFPSVDQKTLSKTESRTIALGNGLSTKVTVEVHFIPAGRLE